MNLPIGTVVLALLLQGSVVDDATANSSAIIEQSGCTTNCLPVNAPEPGSLALLGAGLLTLALFGMRRRRGSA